MRLLSVVGIKTSYGKRATIVQSNERLDHHFLPKILKKLYKTSVLLSCTLILLFFQVQEYAPIVAFQDQISAQLKPITTFLTTPGQYLSHKVSTLSSLLQEKINLQQQNEILKIQNDTLIRQKNALQQSSLENEQLREALNVKAAVTDNILTARITHHTQDGYSQTFYTQISDNQGIKKNCPTLTTKGFLVGRVLDIHPNSKNYQVRIMPITDPASRIPVKIEESGEEAILRGRGTSKDLELTHIENLSRFKAGQRIVTSGSGGIFPAGIPIAEIIKVGNNVLAKPSAKLNDQDFALILS